MEIRLRLRGRLRGKQDTESRAFAGLAVHFDSAPVGLDNHFALEHADADALLFRGLKWTEERAMHELRRHAAAVVRDGEDHAAVALAGLDADLTARADGFPGVQHQVGNDVANLSRVQMEFWQGAQVGSYVNHCRSDVTGRFKVLFPLALAFSLAERAEVGDAGRLRR